MLPHATAVLPGKAQVLVLLHAAVQGFDGDFHLDLDLDLVFDPLPDHLFRAY